MRCSGAVVPAGKRRRTEGSRRFPEPDKSSASRIQAETPTRGLCPGIKEGTRPKHLNHNEKKLILPYKELRMIRIKLSYGTSRRSIPVWFVVFFVFVSGMRAQQDEKAPGYMRTTLGLGFNGGWSEVGTGYIFSIGREKSTGKNRRLRINPQLTLGEFRPFAVSDVPEQFFRITMLELNAHYDFIRIRSFSLVTSAGVFADYTRGLAAAFATEHSYTRARYFYRFYTGGQISVAFRIAPSHGKWAFEWRPFTLYAGTGDFLLATMTIGMDFRN